MDASTIQARLAWEVTPELHRRIKRLWIRHSIAEDSRDIPGLLATLAPDCIYTLYPTGEQWVGHEGARAFYTGLLGAFPDIHFDLEDIVIGPQGVIEVVAMSGTHLLRWAGVEPSGERVKLMVVIHFPWDPGAGLFAGERIYFDRLDLATAIQRARA